MAMVAADGYSQGGLEEYLIRRNTYGLRNQKKAYT